MPAANRSIEISSPRLHCDRAAYYRSIIIPLACRCVMGEPLPYQCSWFCLPDRQIAARCQGNVSVEVILLSRFMAQECLYNQRQMDSPDFQPNCLNISKKALDFSKTFFHPLFRYQIGNFPICSAICIIRYCFKSSSSLPFT